MCPYATVADTQEQRKAVDSEVLEGGGISGHIHQTHTHTSDVLAAYLCSYVPQEVTRCEQILVKAVPAEIHDVCSRLLAERCDLFTAHVGSHASGDFIAWDGGLEGQELAAEHEIALWYQTMDEHVRS